MSAGELIRACTPTPNAVHIHGSHWVDSAGSLPGQLFFGDTIRDFLNTTPGNLIVPVSATVVGALYGTTSIAGAVGYFTYVAPPNCTGTDSVWFAFTPPSGSRLADTELYVFRITHPQIAAIGTANVLAGRSTTIDPAKAVTLRVPWTDRQIVGFVGTTHGKFRATNDSLVAYDAPAHFDGADSVTVISQAKYKTALFRDTSIVGVSVLPNDPAPSYSVTAIAADDPAVVLSASGLSTDGRVAGTATMAGALTHAFAWSAGRYTDLGTYNGARTGGVGINASGAVAGFARLADSTIQGLVWYPDGSIAQVPGGRPVPVGITDDGAVFTDNGTGLGYPKTYWRNGQVVRTLYGQPYRLTYAGAAATCNYALFSHTNCLLTYPNGATAENSGRAVLAANDSGDALLYENDFGAPPSVRLVRGFAPGWACCAAAPSTVWPDTIPSGYVTPPFADTIATSEPLALNDDLTYLTQLLLVRPSGAYSIDVQIADKSWHLVRAITMNNAGQILAIAHNSVTGATGPVLLTPR